jgi:hypothetical protein
MLALSLDIGGTHIGCAAVCEREILMHRAEIIVPSYRTTYRNMSGGGGTLQARAAARWAKRRSAGCGSPAV